MGSISTAEKKSQGQIEREVQRGKEKRKMSNFRRRSAGNPLPKSNDERPYGNLTG